MTAKISWSDFQKIDLRVGEVTRVEDFTEARSPAYKVWVDMGKELGVKKSSAQITHLYTKDELVGKKVLAVVNFPPKQVGPFMSEILVTGFYNADNHVVLATVDKDIENGARLA